MKLDKVEKAGKLNYVYFREMIQVWFLFTFHEIDDVKEEQGVLLPHQTHSIQNKLFHKHLINTQLEIFKITCFA